MTTSSEICREHTRLDLLTINKKLRFKYIIRRFIFLFFRFASYYKTSPFKLKIQFFEIRFSQPSFFYRVYALESLLKSYALWCLNDDDNIVSIYFTTISFNIQQCLFVTDRIHFVQRHCGVFKIYVLRFFWSHLPVGRNFFIADHCSEYTANGRWITVCILARSRCNLKTPGIVAIAI